MVAIGNKSYHGGLGVKKVSLVFFVTSIFTLVSALMYYSMANDNVIAFRYFNALIPLFFMFVFGAAACLILRQNRMLIWSPLLLFLAHTSIFKGLGPLVYVFGNEATKDSLDSGLFGLTEYELFGTNLLNLVGTSFVLLGMLVTLNVIFLRDKEVNCSKKGHLKPEAIALYFFLFGVFIKYGMVVPYKFGMIDFVPPGIIMSLEQLIDLGFALVAFLAVRKGGVWRLILWIALPIHISIVFLEFKKTSVMLALLMPAFGAFLAHGSLRRIGTWVLVAVILFSVMQPIFLFGRSEIKADSGDIHHANLAERFLIVAYAIGSGLERVDVTQIEEQQGWMRISYSGPQAWAMREWDRGNANDTLSDFWVAFVPRVVWPEKPVGLGPGLEFYQEVTGSDRYTRVAITIYADAYWNGGWSAVIIYSLFIGIFFGIMTRYSIFWLQTTQFIYYPAILLVAGVAMRGISGWLISGVISVIPLLLAMIAFVNILKAINGLRFKLTA